MSYQVRNSSEMAHLNITLNQTYYSETNNNSKAMHSLNYSDIQNDELSNRVYFVIQFILLPILCTIGIVGILLTVTVLGQKKMQTSTNCYLISLAIADLFFLVILSTTLLERHITSDGTHFHYFQIYFVYATIFMKAFLIASVWLTVMLSIERFIAICMPMRASIFCRLTLARVICVVIYIFALICRLPNFWEQSVVSAIHTQTNQTFHTIQQKALSFDIDYNIYYPWIVDGIITALIPILLLVTLNGCLIYQVSKSTRYLSATMLRDSEMRHELSREQLQLTTMLICIVIVFFCCAAPHVVYITIISIYSNQATTTSTFFILSILHSTFKLLLVTKSSINFILYCWFSEKFWFTLKGLFHFIPCIRQTPLQINGSHCVTTNSRRKSSLLSKETLM